MAKIEFDPRDVDDSKDKFPTLPAGRYRVEIIESDNVPTKKGTGFFIYLVMRVVEGPYENRRLFDRINYINDNPVTQQIGQKQLKRVYRLCGLPGGVSDTSELHYHRFFISVGIKQDAGYGQQNVIRYTATEEDGPEPGLRKATLSEAKAALAASLEVAPQRPTPTGTARPWKQATRF